ncbi:hypothetical protein C7437_101512 [Psychrobacillus insolitus]|uniref:PLD phosphodiesterase domain-containing protein n=1 Tax=Psychrobacillus insolitus TaxID=1461 RepID=A0A2W7NA72_9BACI|nr:hypothetical protein [Psychrobacillus insolitus]PZX07399.1 hypothetical protein C7437_101512 [Psychrobacillus insolitus]
MEVIARIPLGDIEFICSQGEYNFRDVLNDFPNAKEIFITTYSIKYNDELLQHLKNVKGKVTLISSVPNVFKEEHLTKMSTERRAAAIKTARRNIQNYIELFQKDKDSISHYINLDAHLKIVMTENIAYIGSGNFYGKENIEAGILIKNTDYIEKLSNELIPLLTNHKKTIAIDSKIIINGEYFINLYTDLENIISSIKESYQDLFDRHIELIIKVESNGEDYIGDFKDEFEFDAFFLSYKLEHLESLLEEHYDAEYQEYMVGDDIVSYLIRFGFEPKSDDDYGGYNPFYESRNIIKGILQWFNEPYYEIFKRKTYTDFNSLFELLDMRMKELVEEKNFLIKHINGQKELKKK